MCEIANFWHSKESLISTDSTAPAMILLYRINEQKLCYKIINYVFSAMICNIFYENVWKSCFLFRKKKKKKKSFGMMSYMWAITYRYIYLLKHS